MSEIMIFAGTLEGRTIAEFLNEYGVSCFVSVATDYGEELLPKGESIHILKGRMEQADMEQVFQHHHIETVIDATHPYAALVTENIRSACENTGVSYVRLLRQEEATDTACVYVESVQEAADYLKKHEGRAFLTTGSKELSVFTQVPDYEKRFVARVLPSKEVVKQCEALGFKGKNLIAMQGPFSRQMNEAMLKDYQVQYLVTKESGKAGGFGDKLQAAAACNVTPIVIGRPVKEEGLSLEECKYYLTKLCRLNRKRKVVLAGIGMGDAGSMTLEVKEACMQAQVLIGAKRMVESVKQNLSLGDKPSFTAYEAEKIIDYIKEQEEYDSFLILLSGDPGFYSGAKKIIEGLNTNSGMEIRVLAGLSSLIYLAAKCRIPWENSAMLSMHGRNGNYLARVKEHRYTFLLTGSEAGIEKICKELLYYGYENVQVTIGEQLGSKMERLITGTPKELSGQEFSKLSVMVIENPENKNTIPIGIPDEAFIRDKVPMTKEEIRVLSLAKLHLTKRAVLYDVGAGTGSVSVEAAGMLTDGMVYAVERKEEAAALIEKNRQKFAVPNLEIIKGLAPQALEELPAPTHCFIGGSAGNMREIIACVRKKNPDTRFVINAIALETVSEIMSCLKEFQIEEPEIVQISVAKASKVGAYHMMQGQNPIYIVSF